MTIEDLKNLGIMVAVVFVSAVLGQYANMGLNITEIDSSAGAILVNSGAAAVVGAIISWLAPFQKQYGIGSNKEE